jgi:hypothetical protein
MRSKAEADCSKHRRADLALRAQSIHSHRIQHAQQFTIFSNHHESVDADALSAVCERQSTPRRARNQFCFVVREESDQRSAVSDQLWLREQHSLPQIAQMIQMSGSTACWHQSVLHLCHLRKAVLFRPAGYPSPAMRCLSCHYDLQNLADNRCPECAREFDPKDPTTWTLSTRDSWRLWARSRSLLILCWLGLGLMLLVFLLMAFQPWLSPARPFNIWLYLVTTLMPMLSIAVFSTYLVKRARSLR